MRIDIKAPTRGRLVSLCLVAALAAAPYGKVVAANLPAGAAMESGNRLEPSVLRNAGDDYARLGICLHNQAADLARIARAYEAFRVGPHVKSLYLALARQYWQKARIRALEADKYLELAARYSNLGDD